jgi:CHAT domain-containing protein
MNCRQCGGAFGPGANICHHCGAERVVYCVECGTSLPGHADSCPLCRRPQPGSAVPPSLEAEAGAGAWSAGVNHLPALRVGAVDVALDWVWLFDVGQGDFAHARAAAEQALTAYRDADTLTARAVVHQLQGEFNAALALLEEAFTCAPDDGRRYVIATLACLVERKRGDLLPDGDSVNFIEAIQLWGKTGGQTEWVQRYEATQPRVPARQDLLAGGYIAFILASVMSWRNLLWMNDEQMSAGLLSDITSHFAAWGNDTRGAGEGRLLRALFGIQVEVAAAAGQTANALNMLMALAQAHREANDAAGAAWCSLYRGDILASPSPLGRPVLFGYAIREHTTKTSSPAEPHLFDRSRIDHAGARAAYEEARRIYVEAGAQRGVGLAVLRLAYLDAIDSARGWEHAIRGYSEAQDIFNRVGDRTNEWLARAGQLWARLGAGATGLAAAARPLAEEMKASGALTWAMSVGLALAKAGREALGVRGDVDMATRAARVAEIFFEVFDAPLKRAQMCSDRAEAWGSLEATENAVLEWDAALGWLEQAAHQPQPDPYLVKLLGTQQAYSLVSLYSGQADAEGLERARERARGFTTDVPYATKEEIMGLYQAAFGLPATELALTQPGAQDNAEAAATARLPALRAYYEKFQPYMIHETLRLIEEQVAVYAPLSRGAQELRAGHDERAAQFFNEALRVADGQVERDSHRALIFAAWRKPDEASAALEQYIAAGMPGSSTTINDIQKGIAPSIAPALTAEQQRWVQVSIRQRGATLFVGIEAWAAARRQYEEIERFTGGPPQLSAPVPTSDEIYRLGEYGLVADGLGEDERALAYLAQAVEGLETRRRYLRQENIRRALGGQQWIIGIYAEYARLLAAHGDWSQAFVVAEMIRARVLAESLGGARAAMAQLHMATAYRQYTEQAAAVERLTTQLAMARHSEASDSAYVAELERQLTEATTTLDACEEALSRAAPQWRELSAPRADILSVAQVAERLPPGTLLLAYLFFRKYLFSWAVTSAGLVGYELVGELDGEQLRAGLFATRTRAWMHKVSQRGGDEGTEVTPSPTFEAALATALLGHYDDAIATAEHLLFVPFAELNTLPFQALQWRRRALGLQKPISYLPAASLLQYFRQPDSQAVGALVVGDPEAMSYMDVATGRVETLDPLPAARLEAQAVAALYGAQPLVGAQATEQAVREALKRAPRLIHFATHGFLQEDAPLASGVALVGGEAITVDELMGLELKAEVVVFSACDTGRGRLQGSELIGLARGLLYAGARAAVVSLWPVDDVATAMLMEFFHTELAAEVSPARALWQAQLRLQQTTAGEAAPYYTRAAAAYADTIAVLTASGRADAARHFQQELSKLESRAKLSRRFPTQQLFTAATYWAAFQVIGDWR